MLPEQVPFVSPEQGLSQCFGCGQENPIGLRLVFQRNGERAEAEFTTSELHQGWHGVVHGGIIFSLLDEAMAYAAHFQGVNCLTAKTEIRFKHHALVGEPLLISATTTKKTRKLVETQAEVTLKDGTLVAEGKALLWVVDGK